MLNGDCKNRLGCISLRRLKKILIFFLNNNALFRKSNFKRKYIIIHIVFSINEINFCDQKLAYF